MERTSRKAVIQVEDSGVGIRAEDMDHIFEPFFTTKPEGEGTGLGLFVSYGIITKYGGTINCSSHHSSSIKPRGTIFTIKLPAQTSSTPSRGRG
ncbi:MAG: ATP-binding protein [Deltaproteobacteria bacterium]